MGSPSSPWLLLALSKQPFRQSPAPIGLYFYGPNDPKVQLLNCLGEKRMLLILDNVEHCW